ncbi:alpha/beta hydrolase-fold protein [Metallosphaera yellowstonensis]|jgi:S-formylglutathione hydrolase FrmB|nr:alpha/beta hydrolase-fold protein [Metallosphaera yellowstonensis]
MTLDFLEIESEFLRDNPWGDPYTRKVIVIRPPRAEGIPVVLYLSGYFSTPLAQLNVDPLSENLMERMDRLLMEGKVKGLAIALPDTFTKVGGNQYLDSEAVGFYESFLVKEVVPILMEKYSTTVMGVMGKSSGGYGALSLGTKYDFSAIASHSADAYFEYAYLPIFPKVIPYLRRVSSAKEWVSYFWSQKDKKRRELMEALMIVGMAAFYSPGTKGDIELPFDLATGEIRDEVWAKWLEKDPVRFLAKRRDNMFKKGIYIDVGNNDEFSLQYGNRIIHMLLNKMGVKHVFEEFQGRHINTSFRYDLSIVFLDSFLHSLNA